MRIDNMIYDMFTKMTIKNINEKIKEQERVLAGVNDPATIKLVHDRIIALRVELSMYENTLKGDK